MTKILEFLGVFAFISFKNSKIPYRDPQLKPGDDIVRLVCLRNSKILNSKIPSLF